MKKLVPYIAGAVIAAGAYFTGAVTGVNEAVLIAFDKDAAKNYCEKLIDGN